MSDSERGQVSRSAAEIYEEFFVPALFQEWVTRVVEAAAIRPGDRVLDVACGTGALAGAVAERIGEGAVVGLDVNDGMLAVARRRAPRIEWRRGRAEELPFESSAFDAVVSQFGLMFFEDPSRALREMGRVLRPGGRLAVAVWASLAKSPGYAAMTELLQRLFGDEVANALRAPFALGDVGELRELVTRSGFPGHQIVTQTGSARFPSLRAWIHTEIKGWTLADRIDDRGLELLMAEAEPVLRRFVGPDGTVSFAVLAHVVTAQKTP